MEKVEIIKPKRTLTIDPEIMSQVFPTLINAWEERAGVFEKGINLPQNEIYGLGLTGEALDNVLFYCCIGTLYGASSDKMYHDIAVALKSDADNLKMFDSQIIATISEEDLATKIRKIGIHQQNTLAKRWKTTAEYLNSLNITRPTELFMQSGSVTGFLKKHSLSSNKRRKTGISGLSGKTASLYVIFCQEQGWLMSIKDAIPIDHWLSKILIQVGAVRGTGFWQVIDMEPYIREAVRAFCNENNMDITYVNGALWRLGASLCVSAPTCFKNECPIPDYCNGTVRGITKGDKGKRGVDFDLINERGHLLPTYDQLF